MDVVINVCKSQITKSNLGSSVVTEEWTKDALFYRRHDTLSAPSGALQLLGGEVAWLYGISLEAIIKN